MKPIQLSPPHRVSATYAALGGDDSFSLIIVEVTPSKIVALCPKEPFLRGRLRVYGLEAEVHFKASDKREDQIFATFEIKDTQKTGQEIYTEVLKHLDPEALTAWLMELPSLKENQSPKGIKGETQETTKGKLPPPPQDFTQKLESFLVFIYRRPWLSLLLLILLSLFPAYKIRDLKMDPSLDRVLVQGSDLMKQYDASIELFGSDKSAILYFRDPKIFTREKLALLQELSWDLQTNPRIARVRSIFTTTFIRYKKEDDTLYTEPMFTELDIGEEEIEQKLERIQRDPYLHGRLIDVPKKTVVIVLELNKDVTGLLDIAQNLEPKVAKLTPHFQEVFQSGEPTIELFQKEEMELSPKIFMPLISLVLLICFVFFLGSTSAFVITLVATAVSIFWTYGWMTYLGIPIQIMISIIPGVILTLSATEIVHVAASLKAAGERGLNPEDSLRFLSRDIGKALFLTFTTTALGFLSVRISQIQLLQEFAIVATLGLVFAFLVTLLYTPLHLRFFGNTPKNQKGSQFFEHLKSYFITLYTNLLFSKKALIVLALFALINTLLATRVVVNNDAFSMIADRTQVKKNLETFKREMGGMKTIHTVFRFKEEAKKDGARFVDAAHLRTLWEIHNKLLKFPQIKSVDSFAGLIALLNREMREGDENFYDTPKTQALIDQYFIMLSRDDVDPLLTSDKSLANIKFSHDLSSSQETEAFLDKLNSFLKSELKDSPIDYYLTSRNILNLHAANTLVESQTYSLFTMSLVIILLIGLFFRSFKVGVLSLLPNLFPIFGLFGIMGLFDVPLNVGTCIVATITIGVAADDTIHLFTRYFRDKELHLNPMGTSFLTIQDEVTPILTTSLSLALSFCFFALARFIPMVYFGLLSAYVLLLAVISDLYIGPALLTKFFLKTEKSEGHLKWMLVNQSHLEKKGVFHEMNTQEISELLHQGNIHAHRKPLKPTQEDTLHIPLQTEHSYIYLSVDKQGIKHLSPRTFEKICHNLKVLNLN